MSGSVGWRLNRAHRKAQDVLTDDSFRPWAQIVMAVPVKQTVVGFTLASWCIETVCQTKAMARARKYVANLKVANGIWISFVIFVALANAPGTVRVQSTIHRNRNVNRA